MGNTATMEHPNVARKRSSRVDKPAKIDAEIHRLATAVAGFRGQHLAEYLSELLRTPSPKTLTPCRRRKASAKVRPSSE